MAKVQFAIEHGKGRSSVGSGSELVNMFAQRAPKGAKDSVYLLGTPGLSLFSMLATAGESVANLQPFGNDVVVISDVSTYLLFSDGTYQYLGAGLSGSVSAATNGTVVCAVNGTTGVVITTTSVSVITDPDFLPADTVTFIGGFFVFNRRGSGQYFISSLYGTDFDALDFATAESAPDDTIAVLALRREIWLMGENTVEVHTLTGGSFPFSPLTGVSINFGCASSFSARKVDQSIVWLSPDGIVYQSNGYAALRISTHEIEEEMKPLADQWATSFAWDYIEDGHQFYVLTMGTETFCFDFATRLWHKRSTISTGSHIAKTACRAFNKNLVGDATGRILEMSKTLNQDVDEDIVAIIGSIPYTANGQFFTVASFTIDSEVGNGGSATLEFSKTDGKTWSSRLLISLGLIGDHTRIAQWKRLGRHRDFRARIRLYGDVPRRISSTAEMKAG